MNIQRRFPCVLDLRAAAERRVPKFAYDYLCGGIGLGRGLEHNRRMLDTVKLLPCYLVDDADAPDCSTVFLGQKFDRPYGVAPIGLGGLIWPRAAQYLASAARDHNIPFCLSGFATVSLEDIAEIAGRHAWYQHYMCMDDGINREMFDRALSCGYRNLVITVDIPTATRRDHDIRNGLSVPPRFDLRTLVQISCRPRWAMETAIDGIPGFRSLTKHIPQRSNLNQTGLFIQKMIEGHVSCERLEKVRDHWPHNLIVKGVLSTQDASLCRSIGVDAIVVSNHGGRQLDAAHSALECVSAIRNVVGPEFPLVADGGVLTGLDIIRYLAHGADLVLAGRAFMYAVGGLGRSGAKHVMDILSEEFRIAMSQLGCARIQDIPACLSLD